MTKHELAGNTSLLMTTTHRHSRADDLAETLERLSDCRRSFKASAVFKRCMAKLGRIGDVRAFEPTHREVNGWHPHDHYIEFVKGIPEKQTVLDVEAELKELWRGRCVQFGLGEPDLEHGLTLKSSRKEVADYVSKWGMAAELTGGAVKQGKLGSRTPWGLLIIMAEGTRWDDVKGRRVWHEDATTEQRRAGELFEEYVRATKGRNQLVWSRGLRAKLKLGKELEPSTIEETEVDAVELIYVYERVEWAAVVRLGAIASLLLAGEQGGTAAVTELVAELVGRAAKLPPRGPPATGPPLTDVPF